MAGCPVPYQVAPVSFPKITMGWNAENVKPFLFDNTMAVEEGHDVLHVLKWTGVVARGTPDKKLKALVINCHGYVGPNYEGTLDSAGGIPKITGGFGLNIGKGIFAENTNVFSEIEGLVSEIHIYACSAARERVAADAVQHQSYCQLISNYSKAAVFASRDYQPDVEGPGVNMAPAMVGQIVRFTPD
jgi:hypothetical protein